MGTFLAAAAGIYAALGLLLFFAQRSLLFYPTPPSSVEGADSFELQVGGPQNGATLRIWKREVSGPRALVYFGGNAEDVVGNYVPLSALLPRHSIYLVNYRGYGGSTGSPSEKALFADALAVYDHVRQSHPEIDVIGNSLGSGVAVYLEGQRPVRKLVLVTPYDSIARVAATHYPLFPVSLLIKDRFESFKRAPRVKSPTLAFIAENDETIPRARSDALVAAFPKGRIDVEVIRGAAHNGVNDSPVYFERLKDFLSAE